MSKNVLNVSAKAQLKNEGFLSKLSSTLQTRRMPPPEQLETRSSLKWHKTSDVKERIKTATGTIPVYADMSEDEVQKLRESVAFVPTLEEAQKMEEPDVATTVIAEAATVAVKGLDEADVSKPSNLYIALDDFLPEADDEIPLVSGQKVEVIEFSTPSSKKPRVESDEGVKLLDNSAAKHKISIRPKRKHPDPRSKKIQEKQEERWLVKDCESENKGMVPCRLLGVAPSVTAFASSLKRSLQEMSAEESLEVKRKLTKEMKEIKSSKIRKSSSRLLGPSPEDEARAKRAATIRELIETEEEFAKDLQYVMEHYYSVCEKSSTPKYIQDKKEAIFSNFNKIAEFHQNVLIEGVKYHAEVPNLIGKTFLRLERDFDMHSEYCCNEPMADRFLEENPDIKDYFDDFSESISDDKRLDEHLKLPIQRLNDYQLLLKEIIKFSNRLGDETSDLERAHDLMQTIPQRATDAKFLASIEGFKGNLFKLGRLIRHDWFSVSEVGHKTRDRYLFLFKARILITKVKRIGEDRSIFVLKDIIRLPETSLRGLERPKVLEFQHIEPQNHRNYPIVIEARNQETREAWLEVVQEHVIDTASVDDLLFDDEIRVVSEEGEEERGHISPVAEGEDLIEDLPEDIVEGDQVVPESLAVAEDVKTSKDVEELKEELQETAAVDTSSKRALEKEKEESVEGKEHSPPPKRRVLSPSEQVPIEVEHKEEVDLKSKPEPKTEKEKPVLIETESVSVKDTFTKVSDTTLLAEEYQVPEEKPKEQVITEHLEELPEEVKPEVSKPLEVTSKRPIEEEKEAGKREPSPPHKKRASEKAEVTPVEVPEKREEEQKLKQEEKGKLEQVEITAVKAEEKVAEHKQDLTVGVKEDRHEKVSDPSLEPPSVTKAISSPPSSTGVKEQGKDSDSSSLSKVSSDKSKKEKKVSDTAESKESKRKDSKKKSSVQEELDTKLPEEKNKKEEAKTETLKEVTIEKVTKKEEQVKPKVEDTEKKEKQPVKQKESKTKDISDSEKKLEATSVAQKLAEKKVPLKKELELSETEKEEPKKKVSKTDKKESTKVKEETKLSPPEAEKVAQESTKKEPKKEKAIKEEKEEDKKREEISVVKTPQEKERDQLTMDKTQGIVGLVEERPESEGRHAHTSVAAAWRAPPTGPKPVFKRSISGDVVEPSDNANFICEVEHSGAYYVTWLKDNKALDDKLADRVLQEDEGDKHVLKLMHCKIEDSGIYTAKATDTNGISATCSAQLLVQKFTPEEREARIKDKKPFFLVKMMPTEVIENTKLSYAVHVKGDPMPKVTFYKDTKPLKEDDRVTIRKDGDHGKYELLINHVKMDDSGAYKCVAMNTHGTAECEAPMTVAEEQKALENLGGKGSLLEKGEKADFKWFRDGVEFDPVERFNVMFKDEEDTLALVFQNVTPDDAGIYTCVASTSCGKISCSAELTVEGSVKRLMKDPEPPKFEDELSDTYAATAGTAMLECRITGYPQPELSWKKNGMDLKVGGRIKQLWEDDENVTLIIKNITEGDKGNYRVTAKNDLGEADSSCKLIIRCVPKFRKFDKMVGCSLGKPLTFTVEAEGEPTPEVKWMKDGREIVPDEHIKLESAPGGKFTIKIDSMNESDCGNYSVVATNDMGQRAESFEIQADTPPEITRALDAEIEKKAGIDHTFEVRAHGTPAPDATWYLNGKEIDKDNPKYKISRDGQFYMLRVRSISRLDRGTYKIVLNNQNGTAQCEGNMLVRGPPEFTKPLSDACAKEGAKDIKLFAEWDANPRPSVKWTFNDKTIHEDMPGFVVKSTDTTSLLTIKLASEEFVGNYTVQASNEYGDRSSSARFRLHEAPKLIKELEDVEFLEDTKCVYKCQVSGVPVPDIRWTKDGKKWSADEKRVITKKDGEEVYMLIFDQAKTEDSARYTAVIANVEGSVSTEGSIIVNTPPHITGSNFRDGKTFIAMHKFVLEVHATAVPEAVATWYCNGKELKEEEDSVKFSYDGKTYKLERIGSDPEQSGEYKCKLKNKIKEEEEKGIVTIIEKEARVRQPLKNVYVKEKTDGKIQCQIVGDPIPTVEWFRNGKPIQSSDRITITEDRDKRMHYLTFKDVEEADKCTFSLKGKNQHGECETSCEMAIYVVPCAGELQDTVVDFGSDLFLNVNIHAIPPPEMTWFKNGKKLDESDRVIYLRDETAEVYSLQIKSVVLEDDATYTYSGKNDVGEATGKSVVKIHTEKPTIVTDLEDMDVCLEDEVTFTIKCAGLPPPEVEWKNKNAVVNKVDRYTTQHPEEEVHTITLKDLVLEDYGTITGTAKNLVGEAVSKAELTQRKLSCEVIEGLENVTKGAEGDDVTLTVTIRGSPRPKFVWTKDGDVVENSANFKLDFKKLNYCEATISLTIVDAAAINSGQYRLRFFNELNEAQAETALIVRAERRKPTIKNVPEDTSVTELEPAMFRCKISGHPKPDVTWLKDGRVVRPTDILNTGMTAKGEYYLEFKNTTLEDSGKYTIVASNDEGKVECEVHLEVKPSPSKPKFIEGLKATNVITGYPCRMEVQLGGHPLPKVTWKKNGKPVEIDGNKIKEIITEDGRVILQIACATDDDAGEYSAVAANDLGENSSSATLSVLGHERKDGQPDGRPKFSEGLKDATYDEGKTIRLPVGIRGGPVPDMKWYKDGKEIKLGDRVFFTYDGDKSYLEIRPSVGGDSGKYKCVLQNPNGSVESECQVNIRKCFEAPSFTYKFPNQQQIPGMDAKFSIKVDGVPKPEISWYFNGKPITPDGEKYRLRKEADGLTLFVKDCTYSDSGPYKVVASNKEGKVEHSADLLVADEVDPNRKSEAPTILKAIGDQELYEGYAAKFKAVVAGRPQPEYEWFRNGMKLFSSNRIIIERDGEGIIRLTINHVTEEDSGVYELKVWNDFGKDSCKGKLICECISKQKKRPVGDEYKGFDKVRLSGVPIPLADKPVISALSDRRCTLSWNPYLPTGPTTPVTYQVEMCECPEGDWYTARSGIRGCSVDLTNLAPKSDYRFRVRVENKFGVSEPSPYATTYRNRLEREPLSHEPFLEGTTDIPSDGPFVPSGFRISRDPKGNFFAPPRFLKLDHDTQYGMKNFGARVKWIVYGYPTPKIKIFYKDQELTFGKNNRYTFKQELTGEVYIFLDKLTEDNVGWYKCVATNEYGESQQRIRLGLSEYPRVIQHLQETHIRAQNSGRIYCRIAAYPPCDVKWFKDWQEITPSIKMRPQFIEPDMYVLNFNGIHVKDAGLYSMAAVNVAGAASSSCMVHVPDDEHSFNWLAYGRGKHISINTRRGTLEDHYDIGDELGRGTQGVTYHCAERLSGNNFAAKTMWGKDQLKVWMKMEYEMMNLVNSSRRIVRLYDAYEGHKNMVLVMDLCAGGELLHNLTQRQYYTEYEVAYYIRQVLEGLDYMHDRWIAHLGLNIGDLMVTRPNGTEIKIGDLSLARNIRANKLQPLEYGMPEFVAPEIVKGENVSYPADMWAVGIITYILLSGTSPFRGENDRETLTRIQKGELRFDIDAFKHLSEEAKDFVAKLLQFKPENRMDVKNALCHPWMKFSEITPHDAYKINTDRLRTYSSKFRDWYTNASCRRWFRRRPLESAFTHPSKMVYPPGEVYTPPESPEREVLPAKPDDFTIPQRDLSYEIGVIRNDSRYQQGPDTYLLQLRDTDFPVRLRKYMNLARERSPIAMFTGRDTGYDYERVPVVHERRRFTDIMDEEIDDERRRTMIDKYTSGFIKSKQATCSLDLPKRVKCEIASRYTIRDEAEAIKMEEREKGVGPFIREKPPSTAITEGMALTLTCVVTGDPEPVVQWFRNDIILGDTPRMAITSTGGRSQLYISECKDFDVGFYKLVARNCNGQATHRFRIIKGEIPGMCDPPELQQVSGTQILLKWRTPIDDGGASIEVYHLQMRPVGEVVWTTLTDSQTQELYLADGLEPLKAYQFRVAAKNIRGWGEFSISTPAIRTGSKDVISIKMPVEQQLQQKHPKLQVLQLPGARGEIRDLLDYGREVQHVPLKSGEAAMLQMKKYKMAYEISRGRFSSVMRCVRHDDQRTFACKIFLRKEREDTVRKEYEIAKSLRHERLAAMYEAYDLPEVTAFIIEYLGGPDIITFLSNKLQYTEQNVSLVINQVLDAVSYLHWRGVCHLDIQPDNVVVTSPNKVDVKLVDFGGSREVSRNGTDVEVNGLIDYIAPEVLCDKKAFPNSDVWSIGVLAYVLLTGNSPFLGGSEEETLTNIQCVRLKFETLGELVSQEATRFIMLIFKRDPSKRPTEEECIDHKWLGENDFMVKKRERSLLSTTRLREYSSAYHKAREQQASKSPSFESFLAEC